MTTHPVTLGGWPFLGRFTTVPCFVHLWLMVLTVDFWSLRALEIYFYFFYIVNFRCQEQMNVWKFSLINKVADLMDIKLLFKFDP